ncbi:MAG: hypothetical protein YYHSYBAR_000427 [Candidatus Fervidibacter sacchari]
MRSDTAHATDFAEILQSGESLTSEGTALAVPKFFGRAGTRPPKLLAIRQLPIAIRCRFGPAGTSPSYFVSIPYPDPVLSQLA